MSENGEFAAAAGASLATMESAITTTASVASLDDAICEKARLSRDPRFDGLFFTAVSSTGIYCRPVCPAPPPRRENVSYYRHAAQAEGDGYRPCLRCRPELSPGDPDRRRGDSVLAQALRLIDGGALDDAPLSRIAEDVGLSERQLRRVFVEQLGATPTQVNATRRLLFAKQLLTETTLPVTDVAMAAGFASLRRFNAAFRDAYRLAPRELRRQRDDLPEARPTGDALRLRLAFRPPYDFDGLLDFFRVRALPGVEVVDDDSYARSIGSGDKAAWFRLSRGDHAEAPLRLELQGVATAELRSVVSRIRRQFDLDADPAAIADGLSADPAMRRRVRRAPGLRLPGAWDGFEIAVRAVLGQQVSVAAARTLASRLVERFGERIDAATVSPLTHRFPTAAALVHADLGSLGLTRKRAETIRGIAAALLDGRVGFSSQQSLDEFIASWTALPGIGPWTASYIALRGLGHPDAFLDGDLVLRRNVLRRAASTDETALSIRALREHAERWRPWRGYAVFHLWRDAPSPVVKQAAFRGSASTSTIKPTSGNRSPA